VSGDGEGRYRDEGGHGGKKDEGKNHADKSDDGKNDQRKMISIMAWDCTILVLLISIGSLVPKRNRGHPSCQDLYVTGLSGNQILLKDLRISATAQHNMYYQTRRMGAVTIRGYRLILVQCALPFRWYRHLRLRADKDEGLALVRGYLERNGVGHAL